MPHTDDVVRLSVEIPREVNEMLARICPWGTKAEVIRSLVELLIREWNSNKHIQTDLMNGRCKLVSNFEKQVERE